jgi:hypothetical protein
MCYTDEEYASPIQTNGGSRFTHCTILLKCLEYESQRDGNQFPCLVSASKPQVQCFQAFSVIKVDIEVF